MAFEDDLERIETIVAQLEREEMPLDRALALFEEGVERLRRAAAALGAAEGQVKRLVEQSDGGITLTDE
jgi:exodeoxyribonuclease VII small subunit